MTRRTLGRCWWGCHSWQKLLRRWRWGVQHSGEAVTAQVQWCGGEFTSFIIIDSKYSAQLTIHPMSALTLTPRALYEEVAEQLRQRIFRRELEPGSWIDELKIAEEFGISRTPLREALKVLAAEGLVTMKVRRGAYVTEMSEKDLRDVYHLLSLLESDAAGVVATTATPAQLQTLQDLHAELEAADNRWRSQMVADLRKVMKLNRHNSLLKQGRIEDSLKEHRAILGAMMARDAKATVKAMQAHFAQGLEAAT